jgi:hypothetical protein
VEEEGLLQRRADPTFYIKQNGGKTLLKLVFYIKITCGVRIDMEFVYVYDRPQSSEFLSISR